MLPISDWRTDRDSIGFDFTAPEIARMIDVRLVDGWPLAYTRRGRTMRRGGHIETILMGTSWEEGRKP